MSDWTYINGVIKLHPMGRTQAEKTYILETVLSHLPIVSGSESDMNIYTIKPSGHNSSCSCDEFGLTTNLATNRYGQYSRSNGWYYCQDEYILIVEGHLRDRLFDQTYREFQNWLCRLAKRISIDDVLIDIKGYDKEIILRNDYLSNGYETKYGQLFEIPTWCKDDKDDTEPNWCEYLMWDKGIGTSLPMMLEYKYYNNQENDNEVERRMGVYN